MKLTNDTICNMVKNNSLKLMIKPEIVQCEMQIIKDYEKNVVACNT